MNIDELYHLYLGHLKICTDTRSITPGCIFFALKGERFDGNSFALNALSEGAAYAVVDDPSLQHEKFISVGNVLSALQELANHHRHQLSCPVLAITGSNGKTTTKELVNAVLSKKFKTSCTKGNLNNHIGVPLTILSADVQTEMLIVEMGANHQKEIEALCKIAEPDYGLITNVGKAHLEGFGGVEGVKKGKGELYDFLAAHHKTAFVNEDSMELMGMLSQRMMAKVIPYHGSDKPPYPSHLAGDYNNENINAAICIGNYFKISEPDIRSAIESYIPSNNRSQIIQKGSNTIIMDAYNANPTSMLAALENLLAMDAGGKVKMAILGEMAELGDDSFNEHLKIHHWLEEHHKIRRFLVGRNFKIPPISQSNMVFNSVDELKKLISMKHFQNHLILIKGSRSVQMEKVLEVL